MLESRRVLSFPWSVYGHDRESVGKLSLRVTDNGAANSVTTNADCCLSVCRSIAVQVSCVCLQRLSQRNVPVGQCCNPFIVVASED